MFAKGKISQSLIDAVSQVTSEGWDDMLKSVKDKSGPQPSGGSGVKQGSRYGGSKQKDKPEHDTDEAGKKVKEEVEPVEEGMAKAKPQKTADR